MAKYSVNLILEKKQESDTLKKLKLVFPLIALSMLSIFIISFGLTIFYLKANSDRFNQLKNDVSNLENRISAQKELEGIYTLVFSRLNILDKIISSNKTFTSILTEITKMNSDSTKINSMGIDASGNLSLSMVASSSGTLDDLIALFVSREDKKLFSNIRASGITRTKTGSYQLGINLNTNKTLLE